MSSGKDPNNAILIDSDEEMEESASLNKPSTLYFSSLPLQRPPPLTTLQPQVAFTNATSLPQPQLQSSQRVLRKQASVLARARQEEQVRIRRGLAPSRIQFPTEQDDERLHREFYAKRIQAQKIDQDVAEGYVERVEERHVIELDDLDPELLTGDPLTERESDWVKKKQARRAGSPSSSFPPSIKPHDQHTEYIRLTDKAKAFDPNGASCVECGSKLWGTKILFPLSRAADRSMYPSVIDRNQPLCVGCAGLFSCVNNRAEKMELIEWVVNGKRPGPVALKPADREIRKVCYVRADRMRGRARQHFSELPANFVTGEQLFEDVKRDDMNCYVVGSPMVLEGGRFDSLTFDHINPISTSMGDANCWSIQNLQPLSKCANEAKGNESNRELKRFILNFIRFYNQ